MENPALTFPALPDLLSTEERASPPKRRLTACRKRIDEQGDKLRKRLDADFTAAAQEDPHVQRMAEVQRKARAAPQWPEDGLAELQAMEKEIHLLERALSVVRSRWNARRDEIEASVKIDGLSYSDAYYAHYRAVLAVVKARSKPYWDAYEEWSRRAWREARDEYARDVLIAQRQARAGRLVPLGKLSPPLSREEQVASTVERLLAGEGGGQSEPKPSDLF